MIACSTTSPAETLASAINDRNETLLADCFAPGAIIRDGGLFYRGTPGVRAWIRDTFDRYALEWEILGASGGGSSIRFLARVSGNFEGSPVVLEYEARTDGDKIVTLTV